MLPRANGTGRSGTPSQHPQVQQIQQQLPPSSSARFSPFGVTETLHYESPHVSHALPQQQPQASFSSPQPGVARTLEEVEAEMRALAQRSRGEVATPRPATYQQQQQTQLQQLQQLQQRNTPPPRMHPHSQSPRFHQQQQQVLLQQQQQLQLQQQLQQLRELQELQELQDYQDQLQMEELERRLRAQQLYQAQQQQQQQQARAALHQRQVSAGPTLVEIQAAEQLLRRRQQQSPASFLNDQLEAPFQQSMQYLPQDVQIQQRLLAEAAHLELLQQLKGAPNQIDQENLRAEAVRKIMEAERMEDKRRRRQAKVAHMVSLVLRPDVLRLRCSPVQVQRSDDPIGQRLHHSDSGFSACYSGPLRRRLLRASVRFELAISHGNEPQ